MTTQQLTEVLPFLKWAGGKRWLTESHRHLITRRYQRYIEPFLGSGAVFFKLQPPSAILCDKNSQLIETYGAIRDDWEKVSDHLRLHHRKHNKEHYYRIRSAKLRTPATRAAQFIYLNRTCWNGLYRVNLQGKFNVPIGTKTNACLATDDFEKIARSLQNAVLSADDFEVPLSAAGIGDFVFIDPPYTVKHNYNGFVKYNESIFSWDDQVRLRDAVVAARARGADVLVTNACHQSIKDLYAGVGEHEVLVRSSVIAGKARSRGKYEELIIKCF